MGANGRGTKHTYRTLYIPGTSGIHFMSSVYMALMSLKVVALHLADELPEKVVE